MTDKTIIERQLELDVSEFRAQDDGDGLTLSGYAAVFDTPTRIDSWEGLFDEQFARGSFKKTLKDRTPIIQFNHGRDAAIGEVPIGAFTTLKEDTRGLYVEARLHDNAHVQPVRDAIASGALTGMSIRFRALAEKIDIKPDIPMRTITEAQLFEAGPVTFPAYPTTSVGVRTEDLATTGTPAADEALADPAGAEPTPHRAAALRLELALAQYRKKDQP